MIDKDSNGVRLLCFMEAIVGPTVNVVNLVVIFNCFPVKFWARLFVTVERTPVKPA